MVIDRPMLNCILLLFISAWWAHVTVTPEARSTAVFKRGMEKGDSEIIPIGGQSHPSSIDGANLL